MSIANRLYDVPHGQSGAVNASDIPRLYIDGSFPSVPARMAYEGRLQIHNAIGACTVKLLSGDLPKGYSLEVDNTTSQVVLKWPSYLSASSTMPNSNFAQGDTGWDKGAGWSIVQGNNVLDPDDPGNSWEGLFVHQIGESSMMSTALIPCEGGKTYTASIDVQTGGAREHSHGAAVRIGFYDVAGQKVGGGDGNVVKQTTNDSWAKSSLTITAPALAQFISGGFASYRMHQDYALWVDNFQWNVELDSRGTATEGIIPLSLRVTDSDERHADWSGTIIVGPGVEITSNINFNVDMVTDTVGPQWTLSSGVVTDRWNQNPVAVPYLSSLSMEGNALDHCPDTDNVDGTFDYWGTDNLGIYRVYGDGSVASGVDFCIELYARLNQYNQGNSTSSSFISMGCHVSSDLTRLTVGARIHGSAPAKFECTVNPLSNANVILDLRPNIQPGQYTHYAIVRSGDILTVWVNGQAAKRWNGATDLALMATDVLWLCNGQGNSSSTLGWPGQIDCFRMTRKWARYTEPFIPPSVPFV